MILLLASSIALLPYSKINSFSVVISLRVLSLTEGNLVHMLSGKANVVVAGNARSPSGSSHPDPQPGARGDSTRQAYFLLFESSPWTAVPAFTALLDHSQLVLTLAIRSPTD